MQEKIETESFCILLDVYQRDDTKKTKLVDTLFVTVSKTYEKIDNKLTKACIEFGINDYDKSISPFQAGIDFSKQEFSISSKKLSDGDINVTSIGLKKGHRIATYFMYKIVCWLKEFNLPNEQDFVMVDIKLIEGDSKGKNGEIRNKLYENMGIKIEKNNHNNDAVGKARLSDLRKVETWKENIDEYENIHKFIQSGIYKENEKNKQIEDLKEKIKNDESQVEENKKDFDKKFKRYIGGCAFIFIIFIFIIILIHTHICN